MKKISLTAIGFVILGFSNVCLAEVSTGTGFASTAPASTLAACNDAVARGYCAKGLKFVFSKANFNSCLQHAHCLNTREPNIPYSADEYNCSGTIFGACKQPSQSNKQVFLCDLPSQRVKGEYCPQRHLTGAVRRLFNFISNVPPFEKALRLLDRFSLPILNDGLKIKIASQCRGLRDECKISVTPNFFY